jgi:lipoprotein-releasing system permease protein
MKLAFEIALIHLLAKPKQTLVAMLGVTFGIGMFITMMSMMTGLNNFTDDLTLRITPHIRMYHDVAMTRRTLLDEYSPQTMNVVHHQKPKKEQNRLKDGFQIVQYLQNQPEVMAASPRVTTQAFCNYGPVQINANVMGVDIAQENKMFKLSEKIKAGTFDPLLSPNSEAILIGRGLAKKLNIQVGDRLNLTTPQGNVFNLKVVGIFAMGIGTYDDVNCYAHIATVQSMLQKDKRYITEISINMLDLDQATEFAQKIQKTFKYKTEDFSTANATIAVGKAFRNILTATVSATLLLVAGFGIYNILNMTILNKMKDIAILKATGFSSGDVMAIFMIQSIMIGFLGSIVGLIMGFGLSYWIASLPFDAGSVIDLKHLPINFNPLFYVVGIIFGMLTTALAGYFPSRKGGKIDPVRILRG